MRYESDMKIEHPELFSSESLHPFYKANKERKVLMMAEALKNNQTFLNEIISYINFLEE